MYHTNNDKHEPEYLTYLENAWNLRWGHAVLLRAVRSRVCDGLLANTTCSLVDWVTCAKRKFQKSFTGFLIKSAIPGVLQVHSKSKIVTPSVDGFRYFLPIIEENSRYAAV